MTVQAAGTVMVSCCMHMPQEPQSFIFQAGMVPYMAMVCCKAPLACDM